MAADPMRSPGDVFELVFVCTANRARSPIAEHLVRQVSAGLPLRVSSAGILETAALPALANALRAARHLGVDLSEHRSRCVSIVDLVQADLVVGFEHEHVAAAVVDDGAAYERTFLLTEIVMLLRAVDARKESSVERARAAVADAHRLRVPQRGQRPLEIADPVGGNAARFLATAAAINDLVEELVQRLFSPPTRS
jgi:protein-tyrosine phosphatase